MIMSILDICPTHQQPRCSYMQHSEFQVQGVPDDQVWQLFNVSNYEYYRRKVEDLQKGVCPFCAIDPTVNTVLFENQCWRVWMNKVAPRSGQDYQFIIPSNRHFETLRDMTELESIDLLKAIKWIDCTFDIRGGVYVIRSGDPALNAKSVPHLHVNYQVPNGTDRVEVTIAKSREDMEKKLLVVRIFEKMRQSGLSDVQDQFARLTADEQALVAGKLAPQVTTKG